MLDFKIVYNVVKLNNPRIFIKNFGPNWSQLKPIVISISSVIITIQLRILNFFATEGFVNCNLSKQHFRTKTVMIHGPWTKKNHLREVFFVVGFSFQVSVSSFWTNWYNHVSWIRLWYFYMYLGWQDFASDQESTGSVEQRSIIKWPNFGKRLACSLIPSRDQLRIWTCLLFWNTESNVPQVCPIRHHLLFHHPSEFDLEPLLQNNTIMHNKTCFARIRYDGSLPVGRYLEMLQKACEREIILVIAFWFFLEMPKEEFQFKTQKETLNCRVF